MTRSACINHPKDKVIEIPVGFKYCERCHHLVPPEMEIVEVLPDMELEAETVEEMKAEVEKIIEDSNISEEVKKDIVVEIDTTMVDNTGEGVLEPLEAKPEEETFSEIEALEELEIRRQVKIEALKAKLAELEK